MALLSFGHVSRRLGYKGTVEIRLESWNDEVLLITGSAELELIGEPKYVEQFRP